MLDLLDAKIGQYVRHKLVDSGKIDGYVEDIKARKTDPYTVVNGVMESMLK
jgi:LAO/AO transport system kinase